MGGNIGGREIFQITVRSNYQKLTDCAKSKGLNADYVNNPDLLLNEQIQLLLQYSN